MKILEAPDLSTVRYGADDAANTAGCLDGAENYCCFGRGPESSDRVSQPFFALQ
jgi:hypothetical protein